MGIEEQFPEIGLPLPIIEKLNYSDNPFLPNRGTIDQEKDDEIIKAFFASLPKSASSDTPHTEFLHAVHDLNISGRREDSIQDLIINLSDFVPEPKSLSQVLRLSSNVKKNGGKL